MVRDWTDPMLNNFAYIGCRTTQERNARGMGISVFAIDEDGWWVPVAVEEALANPSFLTIGKGGRHLYAVHGDGTEMSAFRIGSDGRLTLQDRTTTAGLNPVDAVIDPTGQHLVVTNHISGSIVVRRLLDDGGFGPLTAYAQVVRPLGPHRTEQSVPKPHQAVFDRRGKRLFVPNKGSDTITVFDFDPEKGTLCEHRAYEAGLREGAGPRNAVVHPGLSILFVVSELHSTVYAFHIGREGALGPFQVIPCLPEDFFGFSRASAIVLSGDGRRLHVSNRGHDSICTFDVTGEGRLAAPRWTATDGRTPRFACVAPWQTDLLVANEDSDTIVAIPCDGRGPARLLAQSASPTCIVFSSQPATRSATVPILSEARSP